MDAETAKQQRALKPGPSRLTVGLFVDHAKAVRIPLLIILFGVIMTFWVDQIWELFLLLILPKSPIPVRVGALVMSGCLGFAVWHTARTVYRFNIPTIPTLSDPRAEWLREWLPRVLGATIPLLMAVGTFSALHDPSLQSSPTWWPSITPVLFGLEAIALFVIFVLRRPVARRTLGRNTSLAIKPSGDPRVYRWAQLPPSVRRTYAGIILANVLALVLAAKLPGTMATIGALGVVLMCATFLTITGTYLTIHAAYWQFPLLTVLFFLTALWQASGWNDNHRVRLYPAMHSYSTPDPKQVDAGPPLRGAFVDYARTWSASHAASEPVYLVSSEGGGIRAAAWTLWVLSRLEVRSNGEFSKHMLLGSGVSGGSLGLAWFAAIVKGERLGVVQLEDIDAMVQSVSTTDYLGPTIETMFLTDFLQRFLAPAMFVDRGERLETRFEIGWAKACLQRQSARGQVEPGGRAQASTRSTEQRVCTQFASSWKDLWANAEHVPLLFLNATEVQSGHSFIQQPFAYIRGPGLDFDIANAGTWSTGVLPASAPLSAVVHNSARFTYISPAGSLNDAAWLKSGRTLTRQLVDGGYFENSGTVTVAELLGALRPVYAPACSGQFGYGDPSCPVKLIHISNDPGLEQMRSDDACTDTSRYASPYSHYGEIRAPLLSLLNTREARGEAARTAVRRMFARGKLPNGPTDKVTDNSVFHFRLCNGPYHLPLGWTLSPDSLQEMSRQLEGTPDAVPAGFNHRQLDTILAALAAPVR
jgi:hypothetical protein